MNRIKTAHRQELDDVLSAARMCLCDGKTDVIANMFRASFGGLFCEQGSKFGDRLTAYSAHKHEVPAVLAAIAEELNVREAATAEASC